MPAPILSFIVPAHNEEQLLGRTLAGLHAAARAAGETYEVIVADDASSDRTADVARAAGARVVHVTNRQIARTRNDGAAVASGQLLIFVDADTHVPVGTVLATLAAWRSGAVGGGASVHLDGRLPLHVRLFMPAFRLGMRAARLAAGCYVFCTPAVFTAIGGFDERLFAGEELAFSRAARRHGRFVVLPDPVISSGRKVRTYAPRELLPLVAAFARRGPAALRSRAGLGLWYDDRRHDPEDTPA
jgi:glycosyltransferase involved in cell wall biosynthesis